MADKYTAAEIEAMGKKGQAFKNPDGSYSYPIGDTEDLDNAINAVGRGNADHDAIRKYVIGRAKALGKSSMIPDTWNADGSLKGSSASVAPLELRRRRRGSMIGRMERRRMPFDRGAVQLRAQPTGAGGTEYVFSGYGSVFDAPFEMWDPWGDVYQEVVRPGAFTRTLASSPDVPFLIGHNDSGLALARTRSGTMTLSQDSRGLLVEARMDGRSSMVSDLASAVERGDMDEMSIGFCVYQPGGHQWSQDWMLREMLALDLHRGDVSPVVLAASPSTAGSTMIALSSGKPRESRIPTQPYTAHQGETNSCPQCQSVNDDSAQFCDQCGTAMRPVSGFSNMTGVEDMTQRCGSCMAWCSADAKYCGSCGCELAGDQGGGAAWDLWWKQASPAERRAASHGPMTGTHNHAHPAYGSQGADTTHTHAHTHDGDANHDHAAESSSARRPAQQRGADEIIDPGGPPDSNVDVTANGLDAVKCPYTKANGCGTMNAGTSKFCGSCGGPLYSSDGTLVVDDSGVVEAEESGADANLLSMRMRLLELT